MKNLRFVKKNSLVSVITRPTPSPSPITMHKDFLRPPPTPCPPCDYVICERSLKGRIHRNFSVRVFHEILIYR